MAYGVIWGLLGVFECWETFGGIRECRECQGCIGAGRECRYSGSQKG